MGWTVDDNSMNTIFLLMAQHQRVILPIDEVRASYFPHLTVDKLLRKIGVGDIGLPLVRIEPSQKCAKGIHIEDMARYLDERRAAALREAAALKR